MKCPDCGTEMKPLATSVYCPNDCDRIVTVHIDPERTEKISLDGLPFTRSTSSHHGRIYPPIPLTPDPQDSLFGDVDIDALLDGLFDGTD